MSTAFISYSQDSFEHDCAVTAFAHQLRTSGVACCLDRDVEAPPEGWPLWMLRMIKESPFVLVVCSEGYKDKFDHMTSGGKGVKWEGAIITQELYDAEGRNEKFVPVIMGEQGSPFIPEPLRPYTYYDVTDPQRYRALCLRLLGKGAVESEVPSGQTRGTKPGARLCAGQTQPPMAQSQSIAGDGNVQVQGVNVTLNLPRPRARVRTPRVTFTPPQGSIGSDSLLKARIEGLFNRLGDERKKRFGGTAYAVMYRNFKLEFEIDDQPWTVVWSWPAAAAGPVIDYIEEKYGETIAGKKEQAAKKGSALPSRPRLYQREKELLSQIGLSMTRPEVDEALRKYFGVTSHTKLTDHQHWQWVCQLEQQVREAIGEAGTQPPPGAPP